MKKVIKNNYKFILGMILGLVISVSSVYAVEAYIESNKVSYDNSKSNGSYKEVQSSIDELYERSGIHKEKWIDKTLNGADPVLKDPLIPVEIKPNGDVYYANLNSEWYNYSEKRWANAVILVDNPSNKNYVVGDHILEDDIESYFVWIPRYQYKIWNLANTEEYTFAQDTNVFTNEDYETSPVHILGNTRIIEIKFGDVNATPKMSESDAKLNEYYTHPAFTLGEKDLNGIWVGKFETGYKGAQDTVSAQVNSEAPTSIIIKPDVYSWRYISAKNAFMTAYNYKTNSNNHNNNLDPHMLKNIEYGAIAYLSHSKYGLGGEININNASDFKTGYSSAPNTIQNKAVGEVAESTDKTITQPWNTEIGYLASATGNISGVYDLSGGTYEFVAAYFANDTLNNEFKNYDIYIDKYNSNNTNNSYINRILGDATGEMGPFYQYYDGDDGKNRFHSTWYSDRAYFVTSKTPWFGRGGQAIDGILAGQFYFSPNDGAENYFRGFRIALAPTN